VNGNRILVNVAVFLTLAVVMTIWALKNVVTFDFVTRPYTITAEFSESPGLHPDFEVAYLGIKVGKIKSIRLDAPHHKVVAELAIDRGVRIPAAVEAAAGRKSAVGEPYVDLTPTPGAPIDARMKPGGVITLAHTKVPVAYGDLFGKLINSLKAIDPQSTKTLLHELSLGWEGREDSLRQIIDGGDALTASFADKSAVIDGLTRDLTKLTHTLARHRGELGETLDNSAALLGSLVQVKGEIRELLAKGPDFTARVSRFLTVNQGATDCLLQSVGAALPDIGTRQYLSDLDETLSLADVLMRSLDDVIKPSSQGNVLNLAFVIKTKKRHPLTYQHQLPQPTVGAIPSCVGGYDPAAQVGVAQVRAPAAAPAAEPARPAVTVAARNIAGEGSSGPPAWLLYVPPVLALLVLLRVVVRAIPAVPWRRRRK
jgi:phospholipid/cholesterol/gamma-HCH transport system substrate-binding protein